MYIYTSLKHTINTSSILYLFYIIYIILNYIIVLSICHAHPYRKSRPDFSFFYSFTFLPARLILVGNLAPVSHFIFSCQAHPHGKSCPCFIIFVHFYLPGSSSWEILPRFHYFCSFFFCQAHPRRKSCPGFIISFHFLPARLILMGNLAPVSHFFFFFFNKQHFYCIHIIFIFT